MRLINNSKSRLYKKGGLSTINH